MMADVERQQDSDSDNEEIDIFTNVVPNVDAKALGRRLMEQLRTGRPAPLKERVATDTVRVPLLHGRLFKTETAQRVLQAQGVWASDDDDWR
jgi:hypothetical protein